VALAIVVLPRRVLGLEPHREPVAFLSRLDEVEVAFGVESAVAHAVVERSERGGVEEGSLVGLEGAGAKGRARGRFERGGARHDVDDAPDRTAALLGGARAAGDLDALHQRQTDA
jgi:hypothetical protein